MGRHLHFRMGSFYRTDDRTGFPQRAERTRQEWNGLIVDETVWEARQPQDLVKGIKDKQSVPDARPLSPNVFVGPVSQYLSANVGIGATVLPMQSTFGFSNGDKVGVMLDIGQVFFTGINGAPTGSAIVIAKPLPSPAASGNLVTAYISEVPPL